MSNAQWTEIQDLVPTPNTKWDRATLRGCDPYLVWSDASTEPANVVAPAIGVLVELINAGDYSEFLNRMKIGSPPLIVQSKFLPNGFEPGVASRFITGMVSTAGLEQLIEDVGVGRIRRFTVQEARQDYAGTVAANWQLALKNMKPAEAGRPGRTPAEATRPGRTPAEAKRSARTPAAAKRSGRAMAAAKQSGRATASVAVLPPLPVRQTYLGIIDDGLPFERLRPFFNLAPQFAHLWDQGWQLGDLLWDPNSHLDPPDPADPYWTVGWEPVPALAPGGFPLLPKFRGFLYGRRLKQLPVGPGGAVPGNSEDYARGRYFPQPPRQTHGASVLGLMAPWIAGARAPASIPNRIAGLAMVQLPSRTVQDTSGGSLAMRVLDGLRYVVWQEALDRSDVEDNARPIVANVSYGVHAGPHDGTSMFEEAVGELLDDNISMHVVLPAGNSGRLGCHTQRTLAGQGCPGSSACVTLRVLPDNGRDTFVEIWLRDRDEIELQIEPPGAGGPLRLRAGEARVHYEPDPADPATPAVVHFGAVYPDAVAQGKNGTMILLAIGSTRRLVPSDIRADAGLNRQQRRKVAGLPGLWKLTLVNQNADPAVVDAWIERDDAGPDHLTGSRQAFFPDSCVDSVHTGNAEPAGTLNGIASLVHERLHVVGAMRADGVLSDYTAAGPARYPSARSHPDAVVPADWSNSVPGLRTTGFVKGAVCRVNGTSAACAVYARALADFLAGLPPPPGVPPDDVPPEVTCVTDSQPEADADLRGQSVRGKFPFDVEL